MHEPMTTAPPEGKRPRTPAPPQMLRIERTPALEDFANRLSDVQTLPSSEESRRVFVEHMVHVVTAARVRSYLSDTGEVREEAARDWAERVFDAHGVNATKFVATISGQAASVLMDAGARQTAAGWDHYEAFRRAGARVVHSLASIGAIQDAKVLESILRQLGWGRVTRVGPEGFQFDRGYINMYSEDGPPQAPRGAVPYKPGRRKRA